jgi:uncharacterized protein YbaA (DUF1428 family)
MSESRRGRIVGKVEYREGDGPKIMIRPGPVELTFTATDVTLSWSDGDTRGSAAMPLNEFTRYRNEGAIVDDDNMRSNTMSYIDGFVIAVPTARKQEFVAHATQGDSAFIDHGATRVVECWGADVPKGKTTDFQGAVAARDDETVLFSCIDWPDKAARDRVMRQTDELAKTDERLDPGKNPMPFDGKRMIYGGFEPIVEQGNGSRDSYVQGFIVPVPTDKRDDYRKMADAVWPLFKEYGALRMVEAWGDDVVEGEVTDFRRAVKAEPDERIVFSFIEWPSRQICDAAAERMMNDERMKPPDGMDLPFDGKRMVYGGFTQVVTIEK